MFENDKTVDAKVNKKTKILKNIASNIDEDFCDIIFDTKIEETMYELRIAL